MGAILAKRQVAEPGDTTVEIVTLRVDDAIRKSKMADFRGRPMKEKKIRNAIKNILPDDDLVDQLFEIVKAQREY